ncbi:isoprenoid synthase domain-containing protein [Apiospora kogelbergensis]|uniref:Terpene synthase n=1 Tax=Apiospora kogelbergensis TaxID=1337665 RepID=A0AAW0QPS8_9PEZI
MRKHMTTSHDYVQTLKGQKLRFPDLDGLVQGWPQGLNPNYDAVKKIHHENIKGMPELGKRADSLIKGKFYRHYTFTIPYWALTSHSRLHIVSFFWPTANFDELLFMSNLVAWMYIWDDEMDSPEFNDLSRDFQAGEAIRRDTIRYIEASLDPNGQPEAISPDSTYLPALLTSFAPVAEAASSGMTPGQRRLFLNELIHAVNSTGIEQAAELSGKIPTIDEYIPLRMGTSAVSVLAVCIEYMAGIDLGDEIRAQPSIKQIYREVNCTVSLMNDLYSLRRELQHPFYHNANNCSVAVLYHQYQDLQTAVDKTYELIEATVARLRATAAEIQMLYPERREDLLAFVAGAQSSITGNMAWSLANKRYDLGISKCDGTAEITI